MRRTLIFAVPLLAAGLAGAPAYAAGCLKGAAVGGVAGHFVGHHGLLGAGAGCVIGHHEATKHARERARQDQMGASGYDHGNYDRNGSSYDHRGSNYDGGSNYGR
ncbi:MAG TPA: hypothetical protein VMS01_20480 [Stellaceae bacterium]|jgi:hypothetical protein|nr:hypothetical protein [Stellaceae bacterium]